MSFSPRDNDKTTPLVPPQLPPFLANVFNLKPIVGNPSREEVRLVHEAVRALNNFSQTPELRDTDLSTELSQHLFDIQMACYRQKYPVNILPNDVVYDPPSLPKYIPVELKPVTGPPSNQDIASVHTALRISESFANVPSIFDPDVHAQLSQHLFDIQLARHVQRSIMKQPVSTISGFHEGTARYRDSNDMGASDHAESCNPPDVTSQETERTDTLHAILESLNPAREAIDHPNPHDKNDSCDIKELMVEMRDTLKNVKLVLIGSQNSLARGFNSSSMHSDYRGIPYGHDLGAHSLINDQGEVPETYNLPTFRTGSYKVEFATNDLTESVLARYLRFYGIGEEMVEVEEEGEGGLKIKSGMVDDARKLLSSRLFLNR